jgi:hypothetical protein
MPGNGPAEKIDNNKNIHKKLSAIKDENKEISNLIEQIENELEEIKIEKEKIDDTVKKQIEIFWEGLPIEKKKRFEKQEFIAIYQNGLKAKIVNALDKAESKLNSRKKELIIYFK